MVSVEDRRDAADRPAGVFFVPDRVTKRERSRERGRFLKAEPIADNGAAVVIFDHREPGLGRLPGFIEQQHIKRGMIGLPHRIGMGRLSPIEEIERFSISSGSLVSEGYQGRIKLLDDGVDPVITRYRAPLFFGHGAGLAMNRGGRTRRRLQRQPFNQADRFWWQAARLALIRASHRSEE